MPTHTSLSTGFKDRHVCWYVKKGDLSSKTGCPGIVVPLLYHCEMQPTTGSSPAGGAAPVQPAARHPQCSGVEQGMPEAFFVGPCMPYRQSLSSQVLVGEGGSAPKRANNQGERRRGI